jgi:hypothetical protein
MKVEQHWDEMSAVYLNYWRTDTEFVMSFYGIFSISTYGVLTAVVMWTAMSMMAKIRPLQQ